MLLDNPTSCKDDRKKPVEDNHNKPVKDSLRICPIDGCDYKDKMIKDDPPTPLDIVHHLVNHLR